MANEELQINASIVDNISSVVQKIIRNLKTLENNVSDLADVFQDLVSTQVKYGQATEKVAKQADEAATAISNIEKQASKARSSVQEIARAFQEPGFEGISKLKLDSLNQLSSEQIVELNRRLRESNLSLEEFIGNGRGIANVSAEVAYASKTVKTLDLTLKSLADSDLKRILAPLVEIPSELRALENVANFESLRNGAVAAQNEVEQLQKRLREIGTAARSGDQDAVKELKLLEQQVDDNIVKSNQLSKALRQSVAEFENYAQEANRGLRNLGFKEITIQDIFPSEQIQQLRQVRDSIQRAVRESVEVGAVRNTFQNFFPRALIENASEFDQNIVNLASHLPRLRYATYDISNNLGIFGAALTAAGGAALKFGIDYERAFADVQRTTGVTGAEAEKLRKSLVDLSTEIPVAFADLAQIATLAGQLNIANSVVDEFTSSVAKFAATTDVTVEAAATAFGRLDQLIDGVNGRFNQLGSSILKVGVNAVATESEIINISTQIASVANVAGFSASELIGLSAALASVGTRPELSRGTFTRLFTEVQQAAAEGGDQLNAFARIAGYSADEFRAAWGEGSGSEIVIRLLRGLQQEGQGAQAALAQLGITSVRDVPTLLKLAQSVEEVEKQIAIANLGFIEGTELQNQYSIISSTTAEKLRLLSNTFGSLVENVSGATGPLSLILDLFIKLLKTIDSFIDNPVNRFILGIVAAFTVLSGAVSLFLAGLARAAGGFLGAATASIETRTALGLVGVALDDLNESTKINTLVTAENITVQEAQQRVMLESAGAIGAETAAINANTGATGQNTTVVAANVGANNNLRNSLINLTKQSRAATLATRALGATGWIGGILLASQVVYGAGKSLGFWGDQAEDAASKIENFGEFQQALAADTEAYNNSVGEQRKNFQLLQLDVASTKNEVSDYAKIIFNATGQSEQLNSIIDDTTGALERQTVAIGENTRELLRRQFVQDLVNFAPAEEGLFSIGEFEFFSDQFVQDSVNSIRTVFSLGLVEATEFSSVAQQRVGQALSDIFASSALTDLLSEAGFDLTEFLTILTSEGEAAANVYAEKFNPAIESVINTLESENPILFANSIEALRAAQEGGVPVLTELIGKNVELQNALAETTLEAIANGDATTTAAEDYQSFADALKATFEELYAPINAQTAASDAVRELGAAFAEESPAVVANSQEMQTAIAAVIDSASTPDEAIDGLQGLYAAIVDGGYASQEELKILGDQIIETYRIAAEAELRLLRSQRNVSRRPSEIRTRAQAQEARALDEQIRAQEEAIANIDQIAVGTANSARYANDLAQGYSDAARSARGTANAVEEVEEKTRTLLDYASDLESVYSRAFNIRFSAIEQIDSIADAWLDISERISDAQDAVEDLQQAQQDLASDRALKEYFLAIAETYGDTLRADTLRGELEDIAKEEAQNARDLATQQALVGGDLSSQTNAARQNRAALLSLVREYQDYITALAESGASQSELQDAVNSSRQEFIAQARELGFQEDVVLEYAAAFDDVRTAINRVPRDITVDFNADPALQALNELNAKLDQSIEKAKELQRVSGQQVPARRAQGDGETPARLAAANQAEIRAATSAVNSWQSRVSQLSNALATLPPSARGFGAGLKQELQFAKSQLRVNQEELSALKQLYTGGFTGRGGKYEPAGIVHKGEYVVPKQYVNQSTGLPNAQFLAQLQNGMRGYAQGGFVSQTVSLSDNPVMVELSPYDRKLLENAGNVQLSLNGRVVAQATNANNNDSARRGSG